MSFKIATSILYSEPASESSFLLWSRRNASTIARFTERWTAGTLVSVDLIDRPVTGNAALPGSRSPHVICFVTSNRLSKSAAGNSETRIRIRSAVRSHRLVWQMMVASPRKWMRPDSPMVESMPSSRSSRRTTASRPKAQVAIKSNVWFFNALLDLQLVERVQNSTCDFR